MARDQAVYGRPKDDSYQSFKRFVIGFANALGGEQASEELDEKGEREMRATYREYLKARRASGQPLVGADELPED
jgi:hypothetical protein